MGFKGVNVPPRPPRVTGYIFKIGKVLGGKNKRYFEMNPIEGTFIKYMKKEGFPKNPKQVMCISDITELTRLPTTGAQIYHYFQVIFNIS